MSKVILSTIENYLTIELFLLFLFKTVAIFTTQELYY